MTRMVSIGTKIRQIHGLVGTSDVDERETRFIERVYDWTDAGEHTHSLSFKQIDWISDIWERHFA